MPIIVFVHINYFNAFILDFNRICLNSFSRNASIIKIHLKRHFCANYPSALFARVWRAKIANVPLWLAACKKTFMGLDTRRGDKSINFIKNF
jgi:hypothetical protein